MARGPWGENGGGVGKDRGQRAVERERGRNGWDDRAVRGVWWAADSVSFPALLLTVRGVLCAEYLPYYEPARCLFIR